MSRMVALHLAAKLTPAAGPLQGQLAHPRDVRQRAQDHQGGRARRPAQVHQQRGRRLLRRLVPALPLHRAHLLQAGGQARAKGPPRLRQGQRRPRQRRRGPLRCLGHAHVCLLRGREAHARAGEAGGAERFCRGGGWGC